MVGPKPDGNERKSHAAGGVRCCGAHRARDEPSRTESRLQVELLDGFALRARVSVDLPLSAQRVVAFLALHDRPLLRLHVAGVLWPETSEDRAFASLRTALSASAPLWLQPRAGDR